MSNALMLGVFALIVMALVARLATRDALLASFMLAFFGYCIFAMVGYGVFPAISIAANLYWGDAVFRPVSWFVLASFAGFYVVLRWLHSRFVSGRRFEVHYRPAAFEKLSGFLLLTVLAAWMAWRLAALYDRIGYAALPPIPDKAFLTAFKILPLILLVVYGVVRHHSSGRAERVWGLLVLALLGSVFFLTAVRVGNRTDILALTIGIVFYELYDSFVSSNGALSVHLTARDVSRLAAVALGVGGAFVLMNFVSETRGASPATALPPVARLLVQDYYAPAHMLFASFGLHYVEPLLLLKSNLANSFYVGGLLNVGYPQEALGNMILPGSASRSTGFGYFIFSEGYMALGAWGVLYNAAVPAVGLTAWRRLSSTDDRAYNALAAALCAMFLAVIARSGTHLLLRNYLFGLLPALVLFRMLTGAVRVRGAMAGPA